MQYSKQSQTGPKKKSITQLNREANRKLEQLKIDMDIRHCELCSTQAVTNAHRHPRVWYRNQPELLYAPEQVLFLCLKHHQILDDRSKTTEAEKEAIFNKYR